MNPEIYDLFQVVNWLRKRRDFFDEVLERTETLGKAPRGADLLIIGFLNVSITSALDDIEIISATLNPQIPQKYASMSRDEILGGIGQYEIS